MGLPDVNKRKTFTFVNVMATFAATVTVGLLLGWAVAIATDDVDVVNPPACVVVAPTPVATTTTQDVVPTTNSGGGQTQAGVSVPTVIMSGSGAFIPPTPTTPNPPGRERVILPNGQGLVRDDVKLLNLGRL